MCSQSFAADSLLTGMYLFEEEEMKRLTSEEVVEELRISSLLHCGPPFNVSFSEKTKYFCFSHLTLHEYLAARWFVKEKTIPLYGKVSTMVFQFIAGILSKREDSVLMDELMKNITFFNNKSYLLQAKCLNEYQNKQYAKKHFSNAGHDEEIVLSCVNDVDITDLLFLLDVFSSLNEEKTSQSNQQQPSNCFRALSFLDSSLTPSRVGRICRFLQSNTTGFSCGLSLIFCGCGLNDDFIQCICGLVFTKPFALNLSGNQITDAGVSRLSKTLKQTTMPVTVLMLGANQITDDGAASLSEALKKSTCQITTLYLNNNQITDAGVTSLSEALKQSTCQLTTLALNNNQITDAGVASLSEALSSCQLTTLYLNSNQISDAGVASLSEALKESTCRLIKINLERNKITDDGAAILSKALKQPTCQLTTLRLRDNQITDAGGGAASRGIVLKQPTFQLKVVDLGENLITDARAASIIEVL